MRVLVCGSRDYTDRDELFGVLDKLAGVLSVDMIIEGRATGADTLAYEWARLRGVACRTYPAEWKRYGRAAGSIRNVKMLEAQPGLVVAFPLGKSVGTRHMMQIATEAGIAVWEMPRDAARIDALGEGVHA